VAKRPKYETLVAWQRADDLFVRLHRITKQRFPADERYELTSQIRRAALSVPANIVEGIARYHRKERLQFLRTASASLDETRYYVHVAKRLGYLNDDLYVQLVLDIRKAGAPLMGMIRVVEAAIAAQKKPPVGEP
jgi:four helix bundle protein